jgi:putative nucleotidyltransferase with HDIG domain
LGNGTSNVIEVVFNDNSLKETLLRYKIIAEIFMVMAILISVLIGFVTSTFITKPIKRIMDAINAVEEGNFNYHANITTNDEFNRLNNSLNRMIERLKKLVEERNESIDELNVKNIEIMTQKDEILAQKDEINALYEETTAMNEELEHMVDETRKSYLNTVRCLANAIEAKDEYTRGHCERVTKYSVAIGEAMGLLQEEISDLRFAGVLHDIGKIGIPSQVLNKASRLTDEEFEIIKKHPEIGYHILKDIEFLDRCKKIVYQHHERLDGRGYPNRLQGDQIDRLSRILTIADAYDAMTSSRPYRYTPLTVEEAIDQMEKNKETQFDSDIVDVFVKLLREENQ